MMPNSLGQGHIWWSYAPFCTWISTRKINVGYNFAISQYFFMKLPNYIAYDNTLMMMPNSLGQSHIWWSYAPFCTWIVTRKLNVGYNFAISKYFLMKPSNYIAYDNMLEMIPHSWGQSHIWWSNAPFCTWILRRKLNVGYYIAYDNTVVMMPNSLGQGHFWWSYAPLCTCIFILT
jgi:hypothetical protein